jgi:hypothetical protein
MTRYGVVMRWSQNPPDWDTAAVHRRLCARWPDALADMNPHRQRTMWMWEGGYEHNVLAGLRQVGRAVRAPELLDAADLLARGELEKARALCR